MWYISMIKKKVKEHLLDDKKKSKGTPWFSLFIDGITAVYTLIFLNIPQEVLNKIRDKSVTHNIFRIQDKEYITCGFYCISFIEYMLAGNILFGYTNLFSQNDYKKNNKIIY